MKNIIILFSIIIFSIISIQAYSQCDPCQPLSSSLIDNGDFSNGDTSFNSDLTFDCNCLDNSYCIGLQANTVNCAAANLPALSSPDLSDYMIIQSSDTGNELWNNETPIFVEPNTQYHLSFNLYPNIGGNTNIPTFEILINNQPFQVITNAEPNEWQQICFTWFSGSSQNIELSIVHLQSTGAPQNFIGLDDIQLRKVQEEAISCELMIEYDLGITQFQKDSIRNLYPGVVIEDLCACGNIDLWEITGFPIYQPDGSIIFDIENLRKDSKDKSEMQSVDYNYQTQTPNILSSTTSINNLPQPLPETDTCGVIVAVIDTGIDKCHPALSDDMWSNCIACPTEATEGYNYAYNNTNVFDDSYNGHGTHVAGIVNSYFNAYNLNQSIGMNIMPVKAMDSLGQSSLFEIVCATHYAIENGADVINMSFGYRGDSTEMLYNAIEYAKTVNEIIVVTSAGNDGLDNDIENHYPSNHSNPNLIAVAADSSGHELTPYSAYGMNNVDISAEGKIQSSIPFGIDIYDGNQDGYTILVGTSMAAPQITAAAAMIKQYHHDANLIKDKIFNAGIPLVITTHPTQTNKTFDFPLLQSILTNTEPCSLCCSALSSCETSCNPCSLNNDFCYDVNVRNVDFVNSSLSNGTMTYLWDFGDGSTSTDANPNHQFPSANSAISYNVCLTTTSTLADGTICCVTCCKEITINPPCYNNIPGPEFNMNVRINGAIILVNPSGAGNAYTKTWTIDGQFYSNLNQPPVVSGLSSGVHEVCLEVSRISIPNCSEKTCRFIYINDPCTNPTIAKFRHESCMNSSLVTFEDISQGVNSSTSYNWDFGDGTIGSGSIVNHQYSNLGTYLVCLTINNGQCNKKVCHTIIVNSASCNENCTSMKSSNPDLQNDDIIKDIWNEGHELQVLPNPADKKTTAVFSQVQTISASLQLTNTKGELLRQVKIENGQHQMQMDISDLPTGMYILSLHYPDGKVISAKMVKK